MANGRRAGRGLLLAGYMMSAAFLAAPAEAKDATAAVSAAASATPAPAPMPTPTPTPASSGPLKAMGGDIDPRFGRIRGFSGNTRLLWSTNNSPFFGNVTQFWGTSNPWLGDISTQFWGGLQTYNTGKSNSSPQMATISNFFQNTGNQVLQTRANWTGLGSYLSNPLAYNNVALQLSTLLTQSQQTWASAVFAQTGKTFSLGFSQPLLAKYGINLANPSTLASLSSEDRDLFLMDWYDGLMNFAGTDHVDHWMKEVNWSPSLTQITGSGKDSVIGLLDFTVTGTDASNIVYADGVSQDSAEHGSAVASLMVGAHDGKGTMGIAPMASVVSYNPFDATGTADWPDVRNGILSLANHNASIINMSLGVPGYALHPDWNGVFSDAQVAALAKNTVFVVAAGNDGISQTANVAKSSILANNVIVVGSVDPTGAISTFSNRPGTACLTTDGNCASSSDLLMNRFIVAPGEAMLVSDGQGGVMRTSGTSFAAPLVSGTVALIHDRWPWLASHPQESVQIVLSSARDLGAPGVDPVYGVGELDVTAALSPLSFGNLRFYTTDASGKLTQQPTNLVQSTSATDQGKWEAAGAYFIAYENIGTTFRDFAIPLSSKLVGQSTMSAGGTFERFQTYLTSRMIDWMKGKRAFGGFSNFAGFSAPVPTASGLNLTMSVAPRAPVYGYRQSSVPYQTALRLASPDERFSMIAGEGDGAVMLGNNAGFGMVSDYDPDNGGANPLLGYASGGGYGRVSLALGKGFSISTGVSNRDLRRDMHDLTLPQQLQIGGIGAYRASAQQVTVSYALGSTVDVSLSYTGLHENSALLGIQSTDANDFSHGSTTDGVTLGVNAGLTDTLSLAVSGTAGRTRAAGPRQGISVSDSGLISSSFQFALTKDRLTGARDHLRLAVSQPLHVENGTLELTQVAVVDRDTGELGTTTQRFGISAGQREYVAELLYGRAVGSRTSLNLFGRAHANDRLANGQTSFTTGGAMQLDF